MAKTSKDEIITKLSKDLMIRRDVVEDVINKYTDVIVEEIVNKGEFHITNVLSISSSSWKGYQLDGKEIPPHYRLTVRLSKKIKSLFKAFGPYSNDHGVLTRDNWSKLITKEVVDKYEDYRKNKYSISSENPFLNDDED